MRAIACAFFISLFTFGGAAAQECVPTSPIKITAPEAPSTTNFGEDVALDGDTLVVGLWRYSLPGKQEAGAVYVYRLVEGTWVVEAKLLASDAAWDGHFGIGVALVGDTLVVGSTGPVVTSEIYNVGAVYVFERTGSVWTETQILTASDAKPGAEFGASVDFDGQTIVAGSQRHDSPGAHNSGAVYVFKKESDQWVEKEILKASDADGFDHFGSGVQVDGDTIAAGAWGAGPGGKAYVFINQRNTWIEQAILIPPGDGAQSYFGEQLSLEGDRLAVSAYGQDGPAGQDVGRAYVFERTRATWGLASALTPSDAEEHHGFGCDVHLRGDQLLVGARYDDRFEVPDAGSVYLFERSGRDGWLQRAKFQNPDPEPFDQLGHGLILQDEFAIMGAPLEMVDGIAYVGATYVVDLTCIPDVPGDLDGGGTVDGADLGVLLANWGECAGCDGDLNDDGEVDGSDLGMILGLWTP